MLLKARKGIPCTAAYHARIHNVLHNAPCCQFVQKNELLFHIDLKYFWSESKLFGVGETAFFLASKSN
jgi:hypothetical protein